MQARAENTRLEHDILRQEHPLARFIPANIFHSQEYFQSIFPGEVTHLMETQDWSHLCQRFDKQIKELKKEFKYVKDLKSKQQQVQVKKEWERRKKCLWLSIACSHPELRPETLKNLSLNLGFSRLDLCLLASAWGNEAFFREITNDQYPTEFFYPEAKLIALFEEEDEDGYAYHLPRTIALYENFHLFKVFDSYFSREKKLTLMREAIQASDGSGPYAIFRYAAKSGNLSMIKYCLEILPEQTRSMLKAHDLLGPYAAFREAACFDHRDVLEYFKKLAPEFLSQMIAAESYLSTQLAAAEGSLSSLKFCFEELADKAETMLAHSDHLLLKETAKAGHDEVISYVLGFPSAFTYADLHQAQFSFWLNPFIKKTLKELKEEVRPTESQASSYELKDPQRVKLCLLILRHLIYQNDPAANEEILFLLEIVEVRASVSQPIHPGEKPQELLRLAKERENQSAIQALRKIDAHSASDRLLSSGFSLFSCSNHQPSLPCLYAEEKKHNDNEYAREKTPSLGEWWF